MAQGAGVGRRRSHCGTQCVSHFSIILFLIRVAHDRRRFFELVCYCLLLASVWPEVVGAQNAGLPGKSAYTLFNPTPHDSMRELNADRPDKTDCPFTVDAGHLQIEMDVADFTYDADNAGHGKSVTYRIAPMNAKIGLLNNVDFQLVFTPWQLENSWVANKIKQQSGFEGITPRIKINLMGNDGGFFAIALIPFVTLPIGQRAVSAVEGGLSNSISIGLKIFDLISFSSEMYNSFSLKQGSPSIWTADTWLTYQATENLRI